MHYEEELLLVCGVALQPIITCTPQLQVLSLHIHAGFTYTNCGGARGGAIAVIAGNLKLRDMVFISNKANSIGGALYLSTGGFIDIQVTS